jgi:signal transduction histidine kinase/ActR/RegA family two-component response regulator
VSRFALILSIVNVVWIPSQVTAQTDWVERVKQEVATHDAGSRDWILAQYRLAWAFTNYDAELGIEHADQALEAAAKIGDGNLVAVGHCVKSMIPALSLGSTGYSIFEQAKLVSPIEPIEQLWFDFAESHYAGDGCSPRTIQHLQSQLTKCERPALRAALWIAIAQRLLREERGIGSVVGQVQAAVDAAGLRCHKVDLDMMIAYENMVDIDVAAQCCQRLKEIVVESRACGNRHSQVVAITTLATSGPIANYSIEEKHIALTEAIDVAKKSRNAILLEQAFMTAIEFGIRNGKSDFSNQLADDVTAYLPGLGREKKELKMLAVQAYIQTGRLETAQNVLDSDLTEKESELATLKSKFDGVAIELEDESRRRQVIQSERDQAYGRYFILWATASLVGAALSLFLLLSWRRLRQVNSKLRAEMDAGEVGRHEQEQLKQRVSRLQRMESLGALAGGVAHDFNNLLVGVLCNAELLKTEGVSDEMKHDCVQGIISSAEAASDLSQMMLAYTGRQPAHSETIDLGELIDGLLPLFRAASLKHEIKVTPLHEPVYALADPVQIEQVLLNLVNNSVRSIESPSGCVTISLGTTRLEKVDETQFHGRRREGGEFAYIEVADNGCGIEEAQLEHIFEPFYTKQKSKQGRGLGLALAYGNVVRHNGLIQCKSVVGEGTVMRVLLPVAVQQAEENSPRETAPMVRSHQCGHAVVIDDELSVLLTLKRMLVSNGWTCETFQKPKEALAKLERQAIHPDCVVVDVRMPEMDGRAVVQHLLNHHPKLPVTIVSGYSKTNLHDFLEFPNVVNTLAKPFSTNSVLVSLEQAVSHAAASQVV